MESMRSRVVSFRVKENIYRRVQALAEKNRQSVSEYLQDFIQDAFTDSTIIAKRADENLSYVSGLLSGELDKIQRVLGAIGSSQIQVKSVLNSQTSLLPDEFKLQQKREKKRSVKKKRQTQT